MKKISTIIFLIFTLFNSFGQSKSEYDYRDGYRFINKASRNVKLHNYKKALRMINKAKNSNYGFCGNAWAEANDKINQVEIEIFNRKKEYDKSLTLLDSMNSCGFGADCYKRDSLKIITLINKFGKEKVKESFDKIMEINTIKEDTFEIKTLVYLAELHYYFYFQNEVDIIFNENSQFTAQYILKEQPFYKLLE